MLVVIHAQLGHILLPGKLEASAVILIGHAELVIGIGVDGPAIAVGEHHDRAGAKAAAGNTAIGKNA